MMIDERLGCLRREIMRWNQQISLVSRTRPRKTVDSLVAQCRRAWTLVGEHLDDRGWSEARCWIDIGSGAGLPGLVWAAEDATGGESAPFFLVEPRQKRAWFLNRAARAMGLPEAVVVESRWGQQDEPMAIGDARCAVLSFKALRMGDREVLGGLAGIRGLEGLERIAIVRFLAVDDREGEALIDHFSPGESSQDVDWLFEGGEFLGDGDPRMMVVHYRRA